MQVLGNIIVFCFFSFYISDYLHGLFVIVLMSPLMKTALVLSLLDFIQYLYTPKDINPK